MKKFNFKNLKSGAKKLKTTIPKFAHEHRYLVKPFVVLVLIYLTAFSAILLAGVHYADDVARTNAGYPGWSAFSRYLSTASSFVLHADKYLTNIAPLPQLIAIVLLAAASLILICLVSGKEIFKEKWTKWLGRIIAVTPLVLVPYFLECFSYQYDAPYMALSILAVIVPLCFRKSSRPLYMLAIALGILIACTTYQASIGIFLALVVFLAVKDWSKTKDWKSALKFLAWSAGGFLVTMLIFQKFVMTPRDVYVSNSLPEFKNLIPEFIAHLRQYFELILKDFKIVWLAALALIGISFIIIFTVRSKQNKILACLVAVLGLALMAVAAYAPYSILEKTLYNTRAMYAIGAVFAIACVYIVSGKGWQKWTILPVAVLTWCFFTFAFTYGNALKEQDEYHTTQANMVIADLNEILHDQGGEARPVQVTGQIDYAPAIRHMPESTQYLIHRLLKASYGRNIPWMAYRVNRQDWIKGLYFSPDLDLSTRTDLPVLKDTTLYTISGNSEGFLVHFKGEMFDINY